VVATGDVYIGSGTVVDPFASICGPTVIGKDCVVRTGARIRGYCVFGDRVVVGGEIKSSVLMDEASFPHQCYVGDSICVRSSPTPALAVTHAC
jgi:NDP-sugar pyrophosphorylase family protein